MGMQDKAKHLATLYLEDLSDFIVECIDENFGFSRYAERLGRSANSFDELYNELQKKPTFIDEITLRILNERIENVEPKLVLLSVPFPGNLYSAFRCAQFIKKYFPKIKVAMGGGFPNTELRQLKDKRVFQFFDFITLDDGELPVELLYTQVCHSDEGGISSNEYKRTFLLENNEVVYKNNTTKHDYKQSDVGTPDYSDLLLDKYVSVIEIANPMHSLWSDGRWNKLTIAHGCYWKKCSFCDVSLDYISRYETASAAVLVDRIEAIVQETGQTGFHFVDEAAPPKALKALAEELAVDLGIDLNAYATEMFEAKSDISSFFDAELLRMDSKEYSIGDTKFRVSVLETTAPKIVIDRKASIMETMTTVAAEDGVDQVLLFVVDILREEATMMIPNALSKIVAEASFGATVTGDTVVLPGIMSRKKQIIPNLKTS